jgi:ParB family chromosome partitioning protein
MVSTKELLAQRLQQNTQKHQQAQKEHVNDVKELRRNVQITDIQPSPNQPRKIFNQQDIEDLATSIEEIGLLQPIAVRRVQDKYELIAGERRLKAHQFLNKNTIEVIVIDASDEDVALLTLAENLKREDLTDYEIYVGLSSLNEKLKKNKQDSRLTSQESRAKPVYAVAAAYCTPHAASPLHRSSTAGIRHSSSVPALKNRGGCASNG